MQPAGRAGGVGGDLGGDEFGEGHELEGDAAADFSLNIGALAGDMTVDDVEQFVGECAPLLHFGQFVV